jgi:hypothetical protein
VPFDKRQTDEMLRCRKDSAERAKSLDLAARPASLMASTGWWLNGLSCSDAMALEPVRRPWSARRIPQEAPAHSPPEAEGYPGR